MNGPLYWYIETDDDWIPPRPVDIPPGVSDAEVFALEMVTRDNDHDIECESEFISEAGQWSPCQCSTRKTGWDADTVAIPLEDPKKKDAS